MRFLSLCCFRRRKPAPIYTKCSACVEDDLPEVNRALVVVGKRTYDIIDNYPYPRLESEDEVIISNCAVGLNPIDWKSVDFNFCLPEYPWITGREMAGVITAVGKNVTDFNVGDRVWTSQSLPQIHVTNIGGSLTFLPGTYYRDRRAGCFQQYVTVPRHTVSRIPGNLGFASAASLGVAGLTSAMALWKWLNVPICPAVNLADTKTAEYLLIWGGSAVTGQFATQIAAQSGLQVIAITSKRTRQLVLDLGATHVVVRDGKSNDDIVADIRGLAGDNITRALDLVGPETANCCLKALSTTQAALFAPLAMMSSSVPVPTNITVQTVEMKHFVLNPECEFYARELNRLLSAGMVVPPSIEIVRGGLDSIQTGLERLKKGDMGGKKIVVSMLL